MAKTKSKLKTYTYVFREYNSHGQEGDITITFKAESLDQLNDYVAIYQHGEPNQIPKGRFKEKSDLPSDFYEAGGFCSQDLSFTCKDDGKDMSDWWNANWGLIK